jgi:hypothetical protein
MSKEEEKELSDRISLGLRTPLSSNKPSPFSSPYKNDVSAME